MTALSASVRGGLTVHEAEVYPARKELEVEFNLVKTEGRRLSNPLEINL